MTNPWDADSDWDWLEDGAEVRVYGTDPLLYDTDGDGAGDGIEALWHLTNPLDPQSFLADSDENGIPDSWEQAHGMDPAGDEDDDVDSDGDGLANYLEYWLKTDPNNAHSRNQTATDGELWESGALNFTQGTYTSSATSDLDGDGLKDRYEAIHGLQVFNNDSGADADNDGLSNLEEFNAGTDPQNADTDGDGLGDKAELVDGVSIQTYDPLQTAVATFTVHTDPLKSDTDGDGIADGVEVSGVLLLNGQTWVTNPLERDTDADQIPDAREVSLGFNPADPADGLADPDNDGLSNGREFVLGASMNDPDTDGDLLWDGWEEQRRALGYHPLIPNDAESKDSDGDGLSDLIEFMMGSDPAVADPAAAEASALAGLFSADSDNDGLPDFMEEFLSFLGYNPNDPLDVALLDADNDGLADWWEYWHSGSATGVSATGDSDGDGFTNAQEFADSTDPNKADSDGDGLSDSAEAALGTSPLLRDTDNDGLSDKIESAPYPTAVRRMSYGAYDQYGTWHGFDSKEDFRSWRNGGAAGYESGMQFFSDSNGTGYLSSYTNYQPVYATVSNTYYDETSETEVTYETSEYMGDMPIDDDHIAQEIDVEITVQTDPLNPDTDGDRLPDGYEVAEDLNPVDPADGNADADQDLLTRGEEYLLGTNYTQPDTDGDRYWDGEEVFMGSNPLDPADPGTPRENNATPGGNRQGIQAALDQDSDGDGVSDLTERKNGTDPNDPNSTLPRDDIDELCEKLHNR